MKRMYKGIQFSMMAGTIAVMLMAGCTPSQNKGGQTVQLDSTKVSTIKTYYPSGNIKTKVEAKGNKRDGLTQSYDEKGRLSADLMYKDNVKNGMAHEYYPNGKVSMEINYVKGLREGDAKWHYETGEVYRVTPYVNDKRQGMQKLYYKDGKIKAEIPYKDDVQIPGMKEYAQNGQLVASPSIIIKEENRIAMEKKYILRVHLSDNSTADYYEGAQLDWKSFPDAMEKLTIDGNGNGVLTYNVPEVAVMMKTIHFVAVKQTEQGNKLIIEKKYNLAYKGK